MKVLLGVGLIWKCTQSPPGDREERSGLEEMEGRLVPRGVSDNQSPASLDHYTTVRTAEEAGDPRGAGSHKQLGEGGKDVTNAPKCRDHNQHARGARLSPWSGWGRAVDTAPPGLTRLTSLPGCARRRRVGT